MKDDASRAAGATLTRLVKASISKPWRVLLIALALTLPAGYYGAQIPISGDMESLFPEDTPTIVRAQETRALIGNRSELIVLVGGSDVAENRRVGAHIARAIEALGPQIARVEFERESALFKENALLFLPMDELKRLDAKVKEVIADAVRRDMALEDFEDEAQPTERPTLPTLSELGERYQLSELRPRIESPDGEVLAIKAFPNFKPSDVARARALTAAVDALVREATEGAPVETTVLGDYTGVSRSVNQLSEALGRSGAVSLLLIIALLSLYFRRARAVVLVLLPLVCGLAWTAAFAHLAVGELNLISAFIFAILLGLGIDFAIHALSRVDEEVRRGHAVEEALIIALSHLSRAMGVAALTTILTFLSLLIFDFRGFSHFGAIAAAGIALSLLAVTLLLPPLYLLLGGRRAPEPRDAPTEQGPSARTRRGAWALIGGLTVLTVGLATQLPSLRFDGDMRAMRLKEAAETNALKRKYFAEAERRAPSPAVLVTETSAKAERVARHLEALCEREPRLNSVTSIHSFVPKAQDAKLALIAETRRRITQKLGLLEGRDKADAEALMPYLAPRAFGIADLPAWVRARFTDSEGQVGRFVLLFPAGIKSRAEEVLEIQDAIGTLTIEGETYHPSAAWMFTGEAYATVKREGPLAVALAALLVFLLLWWDQRSLSRTLRATLPLVVGFILTLGIAALIGLELTLFNIVVLPVILGIGVDTAVHLTHRLAQGVGVVEMLRTTGAAAGLSALTTAIGFGSLLSVASEGLRSIGWLALLGILCTSASTLALISAGEILRTKEQGGEEA